MSIIPNLKERIAAGYLLDLDDSDATLEMVEEALAWIDQSPENRHAFECAERFGNACKALVGHPELARTQFVRQNLIMARWKLMSVLLAASIAAIIVSTALMNFSSLWEPGLPPQETVFQDQYASRVGEIKTVILPDGTGVILGGASKISAYYGDGKRKIKLTSGQALFRVAKDPSRPFIVESGTGSVTARGTEFDVKRETANITVTLIHGVVDVKALGKSGETSLRLRQGMQVRLADGGPIGTPRLVDVSQVLGWRNGILRFQDVPLSSVIEDINHYSLRPFIIKSPNLRQTRITGSIRMNDTQDWLRGLSSAFDIIVDTSDPRSIQLKSRPAPRLNT